MKNKIKTPCVKTPCVLCAVALAALAALAPAQAKSHDVLAQARGKARAENQRVLLYLTGGSTPAGAALAAAIGNYGVLGKLIRYEYQLVAIPHASLPGKAVSQRLGQGKLPAPALVVLDTNDAVLETFRTADLVQGEAFDVKRVRRMLEKHKCKPVDARQTIADALTAADRSKRQVLIYLSAPW
jgi:hypothetical protein